MAAFYRNIGLFIFSVLALSALVGCGSSDKPVLLSGHVTLKDGTPVANVSISIVDTLTNNQGNGPFITTTDANGIFAKEWGTTEAQVMKIVPSLQGYIFTPSDYTFALNDTGRSDLNFIADPM